MTYATGTRTKELKF